MGETLQGTSAYGTEEISRSCELICNEKSTQHRFRGRKQRLYQSVEKSGVEYLKKGLFRKKNKHMAKVMG